MNTAKFVNLNQSLSMNENSSKSIYSKIKNASSYINNTTIVIVLAVILFSILAGFYYYYYIVPKLNAKYHPNSDDDFNGHTVEILFFYADWCPHSKTAKPIWEEIKTELQNKTINGNKITFTAINCSEETAEVEKMMNQYNVEGYPTIKLLKDGQVIEYDAKPSKETLTQFLNTVL